MIKSKKYIYFFVFLIFISITNTSMAMSASELEYTPVSETYTTLGSFGGNVYGIIRNITIIVSVLVIAFIGIKIMIGSVEQKAEYKKMLAPAIVGLLVVNLATLIVTAVWDLNGDYKGDFLIEPDNLQIKYGVYDSSASSIRKIASTIFTYMSYVAGTLLIIFVSYFGLKTILGSPEQKAEYKKTFVPLIIGTLIVTLSSTIVNSIWTVSTSSKNAAVEVCQKYGHDWKTSSTTFSFDYRCKRCNKGFTEPSQGTNADGKICNHAWTEESDELNEITATCSKCGTVITSK